MDPSLRHLSDTTPILGHTSYTDSNCEPESTRYAHNVYYLNGVSFQPTSEAIETGNQKALLSLSGYVDPRHTFLSSSPKGPLDSTEKSPIFEVENKDKDNYSTQEHLPAQGENITTDNRDELVIKVDEDGEPSTASTTSAISHGIEITSNEWLLPMRNHPSFPEILQCWNEFVRQVASHGNREASKAPSSSTDLSSQRQGFSSSNHSKRKRATDEGVDDELRPTKQQVRKSSRPGSEEEKRFACHYFKLDENMYSQCFLSKFKDVRTATQHLHNKHHVTQDTLPNRLGRGKSEHDQWYLVWETLFPGKRRPKSPYANGREDIVFAFVDYLRVSEPRIHPLVNDVLRHAITFLAPRSEATTTIQVATSTIQMATPISGVADEHPPVSPGDLDITPRPNAMTSPSERGTAMSSTTRSSSPTPTILANPAELLAPHYIEDGNSAGSQQLSQNSQFRTGERVRTTNTQRSLNPLRYAASIDGAFDVISADSLDLNGTSQSTNPQVSSIWNLPNSSDDGVLPNWFSSRSADITMNESLNHGTSQQSLMPDEPGTQITPRQSAVPDSPFNWEPTLTNNSTTNVDLEFFNNADPEPVPNYWLQPYGGTGGGITHMVDGIPHVVERTPNASTFVGLGGVSFDLTGEETPAAESESIQ